MELKVVTYLANWSLPFGIGLVGELNVI